MPTYTLHTLADTDTLVARLLKEHPTARIWFLEGTLGAGKTTLVQAFCRALGVTETVQSPTYSLVHAYASPQGPVYHLDLYRLTGREEEALDMGLDDYLNKSNTFCFVEWGSVVPTLWPDSYHLLTLAIEPDATRTVTLTTHP